MTRTTKPTRAMALLDESRSTTDAFEAERLAARALRLAREGAAFDLLPACCERLAELRLARREAAKNADDVFVIDEPFADEHDVEPGLYLLEPPHVVGADARRLRLLAFDQSVPIIAVCREPVTTLGLCPIVAIAPGTTVRMKIERPMEGDDLGDWILGAYDQLGEFAASTIDPDLAAIKRLDLLIDRTEAVPEHAALYEAIAALSGEAAAEHADESSGRRRRRTAS